MAKRRPPKQDAAPAPDASPFHSPFAGLASLREQLPEGEATAAATTTEEQPADGTAAPARVVVRRERKGRKGKTVTRISGFGPDLALWARRMKQELGCGGSVEGEDIVLAGDLGDRAASWLEAAGVRRVVRGS